MRNMQVVEQRAPGWVVVESGVCECDRAAAIFGENRGTPKIGFPQPLTPHRYTVGDDVTVEEGVGIRSPVAAAPAVGVKRGDGLSVRVAGKSESQILEVCHGVLLHRSWRWHRAEAGCRTVIG